MSKPRNWLAISNIYSKSLECGINIQISCAGKSEVETDKHGFTYYGNLEIYSSSGTKEIFRGPANILTILN